MSYFLPPLRGWGGDADCNLSRNRQSWRRETFQKGGEFKVKKHFFGPILLGGFVLLLWAGTGCKTTEKNEQSHVSTVIGMGGDARYWDSNKVLYILKVGDRIPAGSTVQTASGYNNFVALIIGKPVSAVNKAVPQNYNDADKVILYENTILKLPEITSRIAGNTPVPDIRLRLQDGSVLFSGSMAWPTGPRLSAAPKKVPNVRAITPLSDKPYYEIRSSNTVVRAQHAIFYFTTSGMTRVAEGAVALERTDQRDSKYLSARQKYDPISGEVVELDTDIHLESPGWWNRFWPHEQDRKRPANEIPRRPF